MPGAKRAAAGKLPAESTSFVGRRQLLAEVKAAFANTRLLTLVGPGGVGKTRVALRAAGSGVDQPTVLDLLSNLIEKSFVARLGAAARESKPRHTTACGVQAAAPHRG